MAREDLWTLYRAGVEEYRFQVQLNTQRFQWYVTLDAALIAVGTGLLRLSDGGQGEVLTALIFMVGAVLAAFTARATPTQVRYQHASRDQFERRPKVCESRSTRSARRAAGEAGRQRGG